MVDLPLGQWGGQGPDDPNDPSQPSAEYRRMEADWQLVSDILAGPPAIRLRKERYLPKYEEEAPSEYSRRVSAAPWRPEFEDALRALASKPFGKNVRLLGTTPDEIAGELDAKTNERSDGLVDDIDGRGNNLTVFAREAFGKGIAFGLHAILIDYPDMNPATPTTAATEAGAPPPQPRPRTIAEEKEAGVRPYWIHIRADELLALRTECVNGKQVVTHVRFKQTAVMHLGFAERTVERIRVYEPGRWELWEYQETKAEGGGSAGFRWNKIGEGAISRGPAGKTDIPIVLFFTGERCGDMQVRPPLAALAEMQIELYRALSRQDEVLTFAGSPMLNAKGMGAPIDGSSVVVGPKRVLFSPPAAEGSTGWEFVQPNAANIAEIRNHVKSVQDDMRRIGMMPMTQQSGTPTATGQSIDAAKAHSAVKAWALMLNDKIEQAFTYTCEWMGLDATIETEVSTDFSVQPFAQFPLQSLAAARASKDISQRTFWNGLQRFEVLPDDFDPDAETEALAEEQQGIESETPIDPVTGQPIVIPRGATLI